MKDSYRITLETLRTVNRLEIKKRVGTPVRAERLPQYTVWTPSGHCLEEFRRLASAIKWARGIDDFMVRTIAEEDTP